MLFEKKKSALIVGCGRLGGHIAEYLAEQGVRVTIMDENPESFRRLSESFGGLLLQGNGMNEDQLIRADIEHADLCIAATGNDNRNNLLAQIACRIYHVPHVFARFDDANIGKLVEDLPIRAIFPFTLSLSEFEKDYDFLFGEED